jgi:hypothetical protein
VEFNIMDLIHKELPFKYVSYPLTPRYRGERERGERRERERKREKRGKRGVECNIMDLIHKELPSGMPVTP